VPSFEIEQYTVITSHSSPSSSWRALTLTSVALAHGIRNRATLFYFESASSSIGVVTNVDQPNFNGHNVYAYLRKYDFADSYDMLRSEKPINLNYAYTPSEFNPQQGTRNLVWVQMGTGFEPPGEGPQDVSPAGVP
jgi:hypothetical protein